MGPWSFELTELGCLHHWAGSAGYGGVEWRIGKRRSDPASDFTGRAYKQGNDSFIFAKVFRISEINVCANDSTRNGELSSGKGRAPASSSVPLPACARGLGVAVPKPCQHARPVPGGRVPAAVQSLVQHQRLALVPYGRGLLLRARPALGKKGRRRGSSWWEIGGILSR